MLAANTSHVETVDRGRRDFKPPLQTDSDQRFDQFLNQPPKSNFKRLILKTGLIKGLKRMSDKAVPKGLKDFEVERGYTRRPPILYIPIQDECVGVGIKSFQGIGVQVRTSGWD